MQLITPRRIIAATVIAAIVATGALGEVGAESYLNARHEAWATRASVSDSVNTLASTVAASQHAASAAIAAAQSALSEAAGKTLDDTAPTAVTQAISQLQSASDALSQQTDEAQAAFAEADQAFTRDLWWPPNATVDIAAAAATVDLTEYTSANATLTTALQQLASARAAWQAEQDRIAAEAAAAAAAAAKAAAARAAAKAASSTLGSSGGSTSSSGTAVTGIENTTFDPEAYIHSLVRSAVNISWVSNLCQTGYLCGNTALGSATPTINLDASQRDAYSTQAGLYVLTHESAHARSWYLYGSVATLVSTSVALTGLTTNNGRAAVEWMADCATIAKIGVVVSGYAYTSSCTAPELAEGARYWQ